MTLDYFPFFLATIITFLIFAKRLEKWRFCGVLAYEKKRHGVITYEIPCIRVAVRLGPPAMIPDPSELVEDIATAHRRAE